MSTVLLRQVSRVGGEMAAVKVMERMEGWRGRRRRGVE